MCFRGRPHISVVRKNGDERGKLANKFTLCSITVAPILPPFLPLQPRKAGFELKSGLKILLYFFAMHEVVFAVVNVVFHIALI